MTTSGDGVVVGSDGGVGGWSKHFRAGPWLDLIGRFVLFAAAGQPDGDGALNRRHHVARRRADRLLLLVVCAATAPILLRRRAACFCALDHMPSAGWLSGWRG